MIEGIVTITFMLVLLTSPGLLMLRSMQRPARLEIATHGLAERKLHLVPATPSGRPPARP